MPSVKNFLLSPLGTYDVKYLFGRNENETFSMDFSYPFSPLQAFAIALSSCDNKLAIE
jgi:tubby-related protein 1